jgi:hypothetical protein
MQRQSNTPDNDQQRGNTDADQHAGEDSEGKAGPLRAPLDGERRGGPDEDDAKIGDGNRHGSLQINASAAKADARWQATQCGAIWQSVT